MILGHADALICPYDSSLSIHQGDVVNPCRAGLSYPEELLQDHLYVLLIAVDVKNSNMASDIGFNLFGALLAEGLKDTILDLTSLAPESDAVVVGFLALDTVLGYAGNKVQAYFKKNYVIGSQSFVLSRKYNWNNGQLISAPSTNGQVNFTFDIQKSSTPGGRVVNSVPIVQDATNNANINQLTPSPSINPSTALFGDQRDFNGLLVTVGGPNFAPGCHGTLGFEVSINNQTDDPIVLGLNYQSIALFDEKDNPLNISVDEGPASPRCYGTYGSLDIGTIDAHTEIEFSVRTQDSLVGLSSVQFSFGHDAGRLSGSTWLLDLGQSDSPLSPNHFGDTLNLNGLQVFVGDETYFPGCNGTIGFQIRLYNATTQSILLNLSSRDLVLYSDQGSTLELDSQLGQQALDCYTDFNLNSIGPEETLFISARTKMSLIGISYVDFVFEGGVRLRGQLWRLILPK